MAEVILGHYAWIKALHVIAVIAWMAGLLYLPRLFVYHVGAPAGSPQAETFKVMERRLLRAIMNPAMIAVWLFGGALAWVQDWSQGWLLAKAACILALTWVHHLFARWRKELQRDQYRRTARFFRAWNEVPTLLMIAIVVLVIVKPF